MKICGPQEAHHGLVCEAVEHNIVFYADDSRIAGRNPICVQTTLTVVVRMLKRLVTQKKLGKTKVILCTQGFIWGKRGTLAYKRRDMGEGDTFWDQKKTRVSC